MTDPELDAEARIGIVLADDHAVVRSALKALLEGHEDLEVVGEAADLASAKEVVASRQPRILILDIYMPDGLAVDAVAGLRERAPKTEIVLLTMERDPALVRAGLNAGARACLYKDAAHLELVEAVRHASEGRRYVPGSPVIGEEGEAKQPILSPRETEVLRLMALGHTNRGIAERLSLSVRTVETHRSHMQQKLGIERRADLTRFALENGLIDSGDGS
jgi:two-component system, NarL family, response regulator NreC